LSDWLASRTPRPPQELSARLEQIVGDDACKDYEIAETLVAKAKGILSNVGNDRTAALELLAADALITYAMEAAAESDSVERVAEQAMIEIASVVDSR